MRPPFVVIERHDSRKCVLYCDTIQKNWQRDKNLTGPSCADRIGAGEAAGYRGRYRDQQSRRG